MHAIKKGVKLTEEQKTKLAEHAKKHSKKHIASMRMRMLKGKSFDAAHQEAIKSIGK